MMRSGVVVGLAVLLVACVGDATVVVTDAGTGDADPAKGDAGGPSTSPSRSLSCNAKTVCTGADLCCAASPTGWTAGTCKADCGGMYSVACDDATDCGSGQVCCYVDDGGAQLVSSYCAASCDAGKKEKQLCKPGAASECRTGSCAPKTEFGPSGLADCR